MAGLFVILAVIAPYASAQANAPEESPEYSQNCPGEVQEEHSYGAYHLRIHRDFSGGCFEILKDGVRVYSHSGHRFELGRMYKEEAEGPVIPMGTDVTGDGISDLVIKEWTGGAHCCFILRVFDIGSSVKSLASVDVRHSDLAGFGDFDGTGRLYVLANDWTFAYWRTAFSNSPAPRVILQFQDGRYVLSSNKMRKPRPAQEALESSANRFRQDSQDVDQWWHQLWSVALDLIYSGNADAALMLFDAAWPQAREEEKDSIKREFLKKLSESPYWTEVKALNNGRVWD
jgi:hypothetical protein